MTIQYRSNLVAGIVAIVFGVAVWFLVPRYIGEDYDDEAISSRTVPYVLAATCVLSGAGLLVQSLALKKDTVKTLHVGQEAKALGYILMFLVYGALFNYDFVLSTAFLGCVTLAFLKSRRWLYYAIMLAATIGLYLLFTRVLQVRLPSQAVHWFVSLFQTGH